MLYAVYANAVRTALRLTKFLRAISFPTYKGSDEPQLYQVSPGKSDGGVGRVAVLTFV